MMADIRLRNWLNARVGIEETGAWQRVTQQMIDRFAELTGDHQWIHVDPERARTESPYGATVAHGYLVLSLAPLLANVMPDGSPIKRGINYGIDRLRFTGPVCAGDRVRGRVRLHTVSPLDDGGFKTIRAVTIDVEGRDKPACLFDSIALFYRQ